MSVTAYTSDNTRAIATGTLYAVSTLMATSTGTVTLRATFANDDEALFPNELVSQRQNARRYLESGGARADGGSAWRGAPGNYVYLANSNNTVSVHKVTQGASDGINTAILSGLNVGDTVVIDGTDRLYRWSQDQHCRGNDGVRNRTRRPRRRSRQRLKRRSPALPRKAASAPSKRLSETQQSMCAP